MLRLLPWLLLAAVVLAVIAWRASSEPGQAQTAASEVELEMPVEQAWEKLSDLSLAHNYVPGIIRTEITTTVLTGPGASRRVYSSKNSYLNETVTAWREGEGFTIELHNDDGSAPSPFANAGFNYQLQALGPDRCKIETSLTFTMRGGALGAWAGRTLMASAFKSRIAAVAQGLKGFYEADIHSVDVK